MDRSLRQRWRTGCAGGLVLLGLWLCGTPYNDVLAVAYSFPDGGGYCNLADTGVSETIEHKGSVILPASAGGTYCSGFTFQVAMRVAERRGLIKNKSVDQIRRFQKLWYGSLPGSEKRQCAMAVEELGIGREIPFEDARPGDFMQLWTVNKAGHSVVFLGWVYDTAGKVVGIRYRSSQSKGIGDHAVLLVHARPTLSSVDPQHVVVARLNRPWWSRLLYPFFWG
jgi:hypothetical protein